MEEFLETTIDDLYDDEDDDMGQFRRGGRRRGSRRRRRAMRRLARMRKRERRIRGRAGLVPPGRRRTTMQQFKLPSGAVVCPGPGDIISISDEPIYDIIFINDFTALVNPLTFFASRTRQNQTLAVTNILTAGKLNYDVDVEALSVIFHPLDQATPLGNLAVQRFYEILQRATLELNIEERNNYVFPVRDCPAGSGIGGYVQTTQTDMRANIGIQNGSAQKGRRKLANPIAFTKNTHFSVKIQVTNADFLLLTNLTPSPATFPIALGVAMHGPEGIPLVPAAAGGLYQPEGMTTSAKIRG